MNMVHNPEYQRFEYTENGVTAYLEYELVGTQWTAIHTIVPDAMAGRGIGKQLVAQALAYARAQGWQISVQCSFVQHYLSKESKI